MSDRTQDRPDELNAAIEAAAKASKALHRLIAKTYPIGTILVATFRTHPHQYRVTGHGWREPGLSVERVGAEHLKKQWIGIGPYGTGFYVHHRAPEPERPRLIAAPTFRQFEEFCRAERIPARGKGAAVYVQRREQILGFDQFTDIEVLPGSLSAEQLVAIQVIEARGGLTTFHPQRR
jgi:hypothetical protein